MKLTPMQRQSLIRASLILLLIAGSYLVLWSASGSHSQKDACSESMEECCKKKTDKEGSGEMIWETFSRQFISTSVME